MRPAPAVLSCPIILIILILLIHVQILIRLKPVAWFQQTSILQDIHLTLLTTVMYPARHIISTYLLEIFVNHLDILSLGIIHIRLCHHTIREITVYPIILDIRLRNYIIILLVRGLLIHINLTNVQFNSSIWKILSDRIQV